MATEYRYPTESSPTASWLPSRCPLVDGSDQEDDDGISVNVTAGGRAYLYQIADPTYFVTHTFRIPRSELTGVNGWRAFRDAILGRQFRITDEQLGGFITVHLAETRRRWRPIGDRNGEPWVEGTIVMRKVIA